MIVKENINFERGQNPKKSLQVGINHLISQIIEKFEESQFEVSRRGEVLDLILNYEVSPENFHNPAGYPKYDWELLSRDFEVAILYMIDLSNSEILRKMEVSNPGIDVEYIDKQNWKITSMSPDKIYEEIDQDYAIIDIADAAEYLWDAYQKQVKEEESFDDEEILESYNFERGQEPKSAMEIGRWKEILREKILSTDPDLGKMTEMGWMVTKDYWAGDFENQDKTKTHWNWDALNSLTPEGFKELERQLNKVRASLKESLDFERGIDPKQSLGIGVKEKIRQGILGLLKSSRGDTKISTINIGKNREDTWLEISDYGTKDFEDLFYSFLSSEYFRNEIYLKAKPKKFSKSWKDDWRVFIKDEYKDFFKACFDQEGYIRESVNFERGVEPKRSMQVGVHRDFVFDIEFGDELGEDPEYAEGEKEIAQYWTFKGIWTISARGRSDNENTRINIQLSNGDLIILDEFRPSGAGGSEYSNTGYFEYDIMKMGKKFFNYRTDDLEGDLYDRYQEYFSEGSEVGAMLKIYEDIMSGKLNERMDFERGIDPKKAMDIGWGDMLIRNIQEDEDGSFTYNINNKEIQNIIRKNMPRINDNEVIRFFNSTLDEILDHISVIDFRKKDYKHISDFIRREIESNSRWWMDLHSDAAMTQIARNSGMRI
jgi:hypothetical protein